jgi:hypothetical protein
VQYGLIYSAIQIYHLKSFLTKNYKKVIINLQINQYITQNKNDFQILWWYYIPLYWDNTNLSFKEPEQSI